MCPCFSVYPCSDWSKRKADRAGFLRGREGAGGGTHILRGRPLLHPRAPSKIRLDRPFFSTNQSTGIAYFTGCTYAFRPIRARPWRTSRGVRTRFNQSERCYGVRHGVYVRFSTRIRARCSRILISAAPCGGLHTPSPLAPP